MTLRPAIPSDAKSIAEVNVASWKCAYRGLLPDTVLDNLSTAKKATRLKTRICEPTIQVFVLEQNNAIIGFVNFGASRDSDADQERVAEIYAVYLEPREWRKGHGSALVAAAIASLQERGYTEVTLWALYNNERAFKFYQAVGFETDGATKVETRADGTELHEVRFRRPI